MTELHQLSSQPPWEWPPDAADLIRSGLDSNDERVQRSSVGLAGDLVVMNDELAARLVALILSDSSAALRTLAAIALEPALEQAAAVGVESELDPAYDRPALGRAQFDEIRRVLRATFEDTSQPVAVRRACLEASVRVPEEWHGAAVRAAFDGADVAWRATALCCMGWLAGFETEILAGLHATEPELRRAAVRSATMIELEPAGPSVLALARDADCDRELRLTSIEALGTLCPPGSHALLVELSSSDDPRLSELARQALLERKAFSLTPPG